MLCTSQHAAWHKSTCAQGMLPQVQAGTDLAAACTGWAACCLLKSALHWPSRTRAANEASHVLCGSSGGCIWQLQCLLPVQALSWASEEV